MAAGRWGVALGLGSPLAIPLPPQERHVLELAAHARGIGTLALAHLILKTVLRSRLVDAVLDDEKGAPA
jgi:hypothetical protein